MNEDRKQQATVSSPVKFQYIYSALFAILFIAILGVFTFLIFRQYDQRMTYDAEALKKSFNDYVKLLNNRFFELESRIKELRVNAEWDLYESKTSNVSMPLAYKFIRPSAGTPKPAYDMDVIAEKHKGHILVNLTGDGSLHGRDDNFKRIIHMSLNLMDDFHGVKLSLPEVKYLYCTTTANTITHYPWVPSTKYRFSQTLFKYDLWKRALPEANKNREIFWTKVYYDDSGGDYSLMVSCVAPVYDGDEFVGIIGGDMTVDALSGVVADFEPQRNGRMIIFDVDRNILACPTQWMGTSTDKVTPLENTLPPALKDMSDTITQGRSGVLNDLGDWTVLRATLPNAPFNVVYLMAKESKLAGVLSLVGKDVIAFVAAMMTLVVVALTLTHLKFIRPTEKFVNFILTRSSGQKCDQLPSVPNMWIPWFETIDKVFSENIELNGHLEGRNRELSRKNQELSRQIEARTKVEEEKEVLQKHLSLSEKMRAIGQLAGGVAHDFNNQLGIILNTSGIVKKKYSNDHLLLDYINRILTAGRRSADLVSQLLAFSRQGKYSIEKINVHALIDEVENLLRHSIGKRISMTKELWATNPVISGDSSQLQNAFLNIALNARDAMPKGGNLTFKTEGIRIPNDADVAQFEKLADGDYIKIVIADTGVGMNEETKSRVFEPFFTNKKEKGMGMGLAVVYGTVSSHRGTISVASDLGRGTAFTIILPLCGEKWSAPDNNDEVVDLKGKNISIMIVDDERDFGVSLAEGLRQYGFSVVYHQDGAKALRHYREAWKTIDLVLLDMILPDMSGEEIYAAMKKINPMAKIAALTGFSTNESLRKILAEGAVDVLRKPQENHKLALKILQILDAAPSSRSSATR